MRCDPSKVLSLQHYPSPGLANSGFPDYQTLFFVDGYAEMHGYVGGPVATPHRMTAVASHAVQELSDGSKCE